MLRVTSLVTELVRDVRLPEATFSDESASAQITLSKTKAAACLKVAAAVLNHGIKISEVT